MEVLVTNSFGLPDDAIVSVRFGTTRRQAPLETVSTNPLKFPSTLESICEPLKIDVLAPIATTRLVLFPHAEQYQIGFEQAEEMEIGLNIKPSTGSDKQDAVSRPTSAMPVKFQDAAASAKDYLEGHGLLRYVQSMLHAVIQVKPKDPYAFMIEQLSAAQSKSKTIRSRPASAMPGGRTLSRPGSAMPAGRTPVPPSSPPPSATGERTRPSFGGQGPGPIDDEPPVQAMPPREEAVQPMPPREEVVQPMPPLEEVVQPMPPRQEVPKPHEVPAPAAPPPRMPPPSDAGSSLQAPAGPQPETDAPPKAAAIVESATKPAESSDAEIDNLRVRMRGLLEQAYSSGKLTEAVQTTLASGRGPHDEVQLDEGLQALKVKMRSLMEDAASSGRLEEAVLSIQQKRAPQASAEPLQPQAPVLQSGPPAKGPGPPAKGSAPKPPPLPAKGSAPPPPQAATQEDTELGEVKAKLQSLLTAATDSGELEETLERINAQKTAEETQLLKGKLLGVFEKATASGELSQALQAVSPKSVGTALGDARQSKEDQDLDEVKEKLRSLMQAATESGKLAEALQQASLKTQSGQAAADDTADIKATLRNLLEDSTKSGELEQALHAVKAKQATDELQDVLSKVGGVLFEALETGELNDVLKARPKVKTEAAKDEKKLCKAEDKQELNVDQIKSKLQGLLKIATDDGSINEALSKMSPKKADAAPPLDSLATLPAEEELDHLKDRLRGVLAEACASGKLATVLGTMTSQGETQVKSSAEVTARPAVEGEPDEAELQAIKVKLRSLMQEASDSGKLVEALATISENQNAADRGKDEIPNQEELDQIKAKLRTLMQEAQESGKLSQALQTIAGKEQLPAIRAEDEDLEAVKVKLRGLMQQAAETGKLAEAVSKVALARDSDESTVQTQPKEEDLEAIKGKLRGLMKEATQSGKLRDALDNLGKDQEAEASADNEMAVIKAKLRKLMTEASENGQLANALSGISDKKTDAATTSDVVHADTAQGSDVVQLQEELSSMKEESHTLHSTVDKLAAEMEALKRTNEELARRLAEAGKAPAS